MCHLWVTAEGMTSQELDTTTHQHKRHCRNRWEKYQLCEDYTACIYEDPRYGQVN